MLILLSQARLVLSTDLMISRNSFLWLISPGSLYRVLLRAVARLQRSPASVAVLAAMWESSSVQEGLEVVLHGRETK